MSFIEWSWYDYFSHAIREKHSKTYKDTNNLPRIFSLAIVLAVLFLPRVGFRESFDTLPAGRKVLSFLVSWAIGFALYYPMTAGIAYVVRSVKRSSYVLKEIIIAVLLIIVFNPMTLAFIVSKFVVQQHAAQSTDQETYQISCGLRVNGFTAGSKMVEAGIQEGDVILSLDNVSVTSVQDVFGQLDGKK